MFAALLQAKRQTRGHTHDLYCLCVRLSKIYCFIIVVPQSIWLESNKLFRNFENVFMNGGSFIILNHVIYLSQVSR